MSDLHTASNPSAVRRRVPILCLATVGCGIASYLTLYQLGIVHAVWEPLFGDGSKRVLHSFISRLLPVPDAALGAAGYVAEIIAGAIGGEHRWREHPRLALLNGAIVAFVALIAASLALVQALVIQAGCTLCLTSAAISLFIAWLTRDEVFAAARAWKKQNA